MKLSSSKYDEYAWAYIVVIVMCLAAAIIVWAFYDTKIGSMEEQVETHKPTISKKTTPVVVKY